MTVQVNVARHTTSSLGRLLYRLQDPSESLALVKELCPAQATDDEASWRKARLAGSVLLHLGTKRANDSALGRDLLARLRLRLAILLARGRLFPRERASAGNTLARLGDPRQTVMTLKDMAFCLVPAGSFWMGSPDEDDMAFSVEKPLHRVKIPYDYWMARYPVTRAQFETFVGAGAYKERRYWREAERIGAWQDGYVNRRWREPIEGNIQEFEEMADTLKDFDEPFNLPNHPVVGVTWYEALAFTRWLTERWRREGVLSVSHQVRLAQEAEWEKAARGGMDIPTRPVLGRGWDEAVRPPLRRNDAPMRRYPWNNQTDLDRLNYNMGIGATSAVGCFPGGASPYGVLDLSGNVWEWCATRWQGHYKNCQDGAGQKGAMSRVLRGGAFDSDQWDVRCASRDADDPRSMYNLVGFRIVVAPVFSKKGEKKRKK